MGGYTNKYYYSTRDLLIIAVLSAIGGMFSVYMGYVIAEAYGAMRVWFPVGESLSGIHLIFIVLALGITNKKGSGLLAGILSGVIQFLMGGHLGLFVVLLTAVEGLFAEIGYWPLQKYRRAAFCLAGGLGTASNVVTFQLFMPFANTFLFGLATFMAFVSGIVFAGIFGLGVVDSLESAGILRKESGKKSGIRLTATSVMAVLVLLSIAILIGAVVFKNPDQGASPLTGVNATQPAAQQNLTFSVAGSVDHPGEYNFYAYRKNFTSLNSQAIGDPHKSVTYVGLPLKIVLQEAGVKPEATQVDVIGSDGYYNTLELSKATQDDVILTVSGGQLKLIANGTGQEYWVGMIQTIKVH